jgi:hypothetical protein
VQSIRTGSAVSGRDAKNEIAASAERIGERGALRMMRTVGEARMREKRCLYPPRSVMRA